MHNHQRRPIMAVTASSAIRDDVNTVAAKTLATAPNLTTQDRQFLSDIQREGRYRAQWITRLVALAARCPNDSDAYALAESLRAFVRVRRTVPRPSLAGAMHGETEAQGIADLAQVDVMTRQSDPGVISRAITALFNHRAKIDIAIDALQQRRFEVAAR